MKSGLKSVFSKKYDSKIWGRVVSKVSFKKLETLPWKRRKTTSSAIFFATGDWKLIIKIKKIILDGNVRQCSIAHTNHLNDFLSDDLTRDEAQQLIIRAKNTRVSFRQSDAFRRDEERNSRVSNYSHYATQ